jgi:tRNA (cmo5U34)-methyltransferase
METESDTNASIWKSDELVQEWVAGLDEREQKRIPHWRLLAELLPFSSSDEFTFVDLGAGTGAASRLVLDLFPKSRAILAEYSPQMIEQGTRLLAPYEGRFRYEEFDMLLDGWPSSIPSSLDAAITSLCVHHLPDDRKQDLFVGIFEHLAPGAWYLNYDPVMSEDPLVDAVWERTLARQDPIAAEHSHHRTPDEQARYENHVRYIIPLAPQLEFLKAAGFVGIDVFWKQLDTVIYGGCRPA